MQTLHLYEADAYPAYLDEYGHEPLHWEDLTEFDEEGYGFIYADGLGCFINRKGEVLIPMIYDHFAVFIDGYSRVRLNGKWGLINRSNEPLIPMEYDDCQFPANGKVIAPKEGRYGILSLRNEILLPFHYDYISNFNQKEIAVSKHGKYGVINWQQETVLDFEWEYTEIVADCFCVGEAVPLFYPSRYGDNEAFPAEMFKYCTRNHQKIDFRLIDRNKKLVHPLVSDVRIWNYNPQNGRAEISRLWKADHLSEVERHFVADRSGKRIPFEYALSAESDSLEIRKRIDTMIWGS